VGSRPLLASKRRWAIAAAILLGLAGALSLTEAIGVTKLTATVIRVLTPDGTLVVEVDDPGVKVTIEGDGGLVITGAGLEEIRLRPGSYRVQAERDGKRVPLEPELVSIAKGGREVVRVKLEAPPAQAAAKAEKGAFVLRGGKGVVVRKYDTLAEAVLNSDPGNTIEIRGNGPFVTEPIKINRPLVIRAADGYRPIIRLEPKLVETPRPLIDSDAALVLEGLELQQVGPADRQVGPVVQSKGAPIYVTNCRLFAPPSRDCHALVAWGSPICEVRNSDFPLAYCGVVWGCPSGGRAALENCLFTPASCALSINDGVAKVQNVSIRFVHNTACCGVPMMLGVHAVPDALAARTDQPIEPVFRLTAAGNIFHGVWRQVLTFNLGPALASNGEPLPANEAETLLRRLLSWQEGRNLYAPPGGSLLVLHMYRHWGDKPPAEQRLKTLEEWNKFWGLSDTGSLEGLPRYRHPQASYQSPLAEKLIPEDFRLLPDTPGYRAGKDGKDRGADVNLVGPGAAYERWKKTPEYQKWLKETGQGK